MDRKIASAALLSAVLAFSSSPARAQFGSPTVITAPGSVTSDQPVEQATTDMDQVQLPSIVRSLTIGGGGGNLQPNTQIIASLDQGLFANINAQNFNDVFPGWQPLPPRSTDAERDTDTRTMAVYHNVIAAAQQNLQELDSEDFSRIFANDTSPNLLIVEQAKLDAIGAVVQELRYQRQLQGAEIMLRATQASYQLNHSAREKASSTTGIVP